MSTRPGLTALTLAGVLAAAGGAHAADPVLPLSEVRPGMVGEARTVVQGTQITTFPVRVVDVQSNPSVPAGSLILIRAEGPLMERTGGIAEGMSGSPVYVRGEDGVERVMGAVAYGTGDEGNILGGVTPIEEMIRPTEGRLQNSAGRRRGMAPGAARPLVAVAGRAAAVRLERARPGVRAVHPLARWTASGLSPRVAAGLRTSLAPRGVSLTTVGGRRTRRPAVPLVPGASLSVLLVGGDLTLGAVGTVTWVDGTRLLGFGHPFLGLGRTTLLLGDAYVFETVPARQDASSYKLAEAGTLQGTITADRADGVSGTLGTASAIEAVLHARDLGRGTATALRASVTPDQRLAPQVADVLQQEALARVTDGVPRGTLTLSIRVTAPGLPRPVVYRNRYAASGDLVPVTEGALRRIVTVLMANGLRAVVPRTIRVDQTLDPAVRAARIMSARVRGPVRPGRPVRLQVTLQPWRAAPRRVSVTVRAPSGLTPGTGSLRVVPNDIEGFSAAAPDITDAVGGSAPAAGEARAEALLGRVERAAGTLPGTRRARLLRGLAQATRDRHDAVRVLWPGQDAADPQAGTLVTMPDVVYGGRGVARFPVRG